MTPLPSPTAPLKGVVGIDIAKDSFVACVGHATLSQQLHFGKETTFANSASGFVALLSWVVKQHLSGSPLWFVVEATGVYYEELAYFLADNQQLLSVLLPNKVKHFARSTELKSQTDQLDARLLCRLGLPPGSAAWVWNGPCQPGSRQPPPCANCAPWPANGKCWCSRAPNSRPVPTPTSIAINPIAGR